MFCPECGEVIAPGPLDLHRASHGGSCTVDQPAGAVTRLWRAVREVFRHRKFVDHPPKIIDRSGATCCNKNDRVLGE